MPQKTDNLKTFYQYLSNEHQTKVNNQKGTVKEIALNIGDAIRNERLSSGLTQQQLADKIGAKKSFISRIENGHSDIQISTLYKIIEQGMGKKVNLIIE